MNEFPETSDSLLVSVKDPRNREAWEEFSRLYRPVIYRIATAKGMQHADAADLTQQVLLSVAGAIGRYERDPQGARFRHWLARVTRNSILNSLTRQPWDRAKGGSGVGRLLDDVADPDPATESLMQLEYRRELYLHAAKTVRDAVTPSTWRAFEMTVIDGYKVESAAKQIGISIGAVYTARSRVMFRLREVVARVDLQEESA